jgi:hypothetical protein
MELDFKRAIGFGFDQLGEFLNVFGKGAALAPQGGVQVTSAAAASPTNRAAMPRTVVVVSNFFKDMISSLCHLSVYLNYFESVWFPLLDRGPVAS